MRDELTYPYVGHTGRGIILVELSDETSVMMSAGLSTVVLDRDDEDGFNSCHTVEDIAGSSDGHLLEVAKKAAEEAKAARSS